MESKVVRVELGSRSYNIVFDRVDSVLVTGEFAALPQKNVLVVADSNTASYLPVVRKALEKSGKTVYDWVFPAGESSKNIDNAMKLCGYASKLQLGRNALFAALGGGVTGDLTGFAASMYMRGVDFIQIPTSLLAMVDSSVGGKTAVDTPHGKNLVGAFHQPKLVVIDCGMLRTLPEREISSGMAEIVKTAMIRDADFAENLLRFSGNIAENPELLLPAVFRSCQIKAAVVSADEKESGDSGRVFLNYGHTFGHALEHLSCFRLAHGEAVAIGMDIAVFAAVKLGLCVPGLTVYQHRLLENFGIAPENFPASAVKQDTEKIIELMKGDKKNGDGKFRAVLPLAAGKVKTIDLDPQWTAGMLEEYFAFRFAPEKIVQDDRKEVAIIGLGLLGSSLALSIDRHRYSVGVWNRNFAACQWAMENNAAEKIYSSPEEAFADADITILCLPIPVTEKFIADYANFAKKGGVVTDIASVKSGVMQCAEKFPELDFVGSHPMAGTEKSGFNAGFAGLYDNADVFVVPGKYSTSQGINTIEEFWGHLGTAPRRINSVEHDALVAHTSHMLHIIASALTRSILSREDAAEQRRHYFGCATGFRDTSRIASSSPDMWKDICMANKEAILPALDEFQESLNEMRETLLTGDAEKFAALFRYGRDLRDSWLCYKNASHLPENIVLCGIKHCGKSTVGREIAAILDMVLIDTDDEIVKLDGGSRSCREIFKEEGEGYFRRLEAQVLSEIAGSKDKKVIALGGGALSNPFVSGEVKKALGCKFYLDTDDKTAFERICANGLPPFLAGEAEPFTAFVEMNKARKKVFQEQCQMRIIPENSPHDTALHILSCYKDLNNL
ncbi:MAG: 3-dehydroquinate synthase [Lentisphaerae bacterium]|nr:3-dehydroquinate synthase [Lentisphaerota bacterium]